MSAPYDPHRDPLPESSDIKAIRHGLLGIVLVALAFMMLSRFCGGVGHKYCTPTETWTWLWSTGGWWKVLLGSAIIWCMALLGRSSPRDPPQ